MTQRYSPRYEGPLFYVQPLLYYTHTWPEVHQGPQRRCRNPRWCQSVRIKGIYCTNTQRNARLQATGEHRTTCALQWETMAQMGGASARRAASARCVNQSMEGRVSLHCFQYIVGSVARGVSTLALNVLRLFHNSLRFFNIYIYIYTVYIHLSHCHFKCKKNVYREKQDI